MIYRRCGCRREDGTQYGLLPVDPKPTDKQLERACPKMVADQRKPKHGRWGYYLNAGRDAKGNRRQVYVTKFATRAEAEAARAVAKGEQAGGTYVAPAKQTLATYLQEWLPVRATTGKGLKPSTRHEYQRYIDGYITPHRLGSMKLTEIQPLHVQGFLHDMAAEGRGPVSQARCLAVLQSAFTTALRQRLVPFNPAHAVQRPYVDTHEVVPWSEAELALFLEVAQEDRLGALMKFAAYTGLRRGEIAGLRWEDVEWPEDPAALPWLHVRRNRVEVGGTKRSDIVEGTPKSGAGLRTIKLSVPAREALVSWRLMRETEFANMIGVKDSGYVFVDELGAPLRPEVITKGFERLRRKAPVPHITFHGLRHGMATMLLRDGADMAWLSMFMGHSSPAFTVQRYGHFTRDVAARGAEGLRMFSADSYTNPGSGLHTGKGKALATSHVDQVPGPSLVHPLGLEPRTH